MPHSPYESRTRALILLNSHVPSVLALAYYLTSPQPSLPLIAPFNLLLAPQLASPF